MIIKITSVEFWQGDLILGNQPITSTIVELHYKVLIDLNSVPQAVLTEDILRQKKGEQALINHIKVINAGRQEDKFSKDYKK